MVPVFGDVMRQTKRYAKDVDKALGDEFEKAGKNAGERAAKGIDEELTKGSKKSGEKAGQEYAGAFESHVKRAIESAQKEMGRLSLKDFEGDAEKYLTRVQRKLEDLGKVDYTADFDAKKVLTQIGIVEAYLKKLSSQEHGINLTANFQKALADIETVRLAAEKAEKRRYELQFGVNQKEIDRELGAFETKMRATAKKAASSIDSEIGGSLGRVRKRLSEIANEKIIDTKKARDDIANLARDLRQTFQDKTLDVQVRADAAAAYADLLAFNKVASAIDGRHLDVKVDVDAAAAAAELSAVGAAARGVHSNLLGLKAGGNEAANSFRSFNIVVLGALTLLPGLIPVLAAVAGGALALGPAFGAAAAGLGTLLIGFSGIGNAVSALGKVQDTAGKDAEASAKKMRSAAQSVEDAERSLARARQSAAQSNADAARAVAAARRQSSQQIQDALRQQQDAEEALTQAQRDATQAQQDLIEARRLAKQDLQDLNNSVQQNKLDERQAVIDVFNATVNNNAVQADGSSTNLDKEQAALALKQAQLRLKEIRQEQKRLADEKKKADKEGVDGTARVQNAQDQLTAALQRQKDAQQAVGDAARAVDRARVDGARAVQDAIRNQQRAAASGAQSIADAQRSLTRAQQDYKDAVVETGTLGSASMQQLNQAMAKLGPEGRKFARFLFGLRDDFYHLRDAIQAAMLPPVQHAIEAIIGKYGPRMMIFFVSMASTIGNLFTDLSNALTGKTFDDFFRMMQQYGPGLLRMFGQSMINWMTAFANLMTIAAPYAADLSAALLGISKRFRDWMASSDGTKFWTDFFDYAARVGPSVVAFFGALWRAAVNLGKALAPWGETVLKSLTGLLDWIGNMDPQTLGFIASSIIGIAVAFQLAVGAVAAFNAGAAAFSTPLSRWILLIGVAITLFTALYHNSETFRNLVDGPLGDALKFLAVTIGSIVLAMRVWKAITGIITAVQVGFAAATYGAAGASYAQGAAAKVAYVAGRIWAGVLAVQKLAQEGLLLATIRGNAALAIMVVKQRAVAAATALSAGAMRLMGAAARLMFGPWGVVILATIALFVLLYKKVDWFRAAVDKVVGLIVKIFKGIVDAAYWVWDKLFGHSIFPDIVDGLVWFKDQVSMIIDRVAAIFRWVYDSVLKPVGEAIMQVVNFLWTKAFKPAFHFIWNAVKGTFKFIAAAWKNVLWPVLKVIMKIVWTLWKAYFKVVFTLIQVAFKVLVVALKLAWKTIGHPIFTAIATIVKWLWDHVLKPIFGWIGDLWDREVRGMKVVWEKYLKPVFDAIKDKALPALKSAFKDAVGAIGKIWDGLRKIVGAPIKFVIEKVLNGGLIAGFNKVAKFVHSDGISPIPVPEWTYAKGGVFGRSNSFAGGGVMPGYTPGQDVHHFVSPTGGRLNLSGGEAILRPEFTAAVGSGWVEQVNAAARAGGVNGVRSMLGYASGGVYPQQSFASGGVYNPSSPVYLNGMAISRVAAAQVALAKKLSGIPIYMMQGGYGGNHIAASGSSHNYPGVGDFGPGSIPLEKVMRQVGFAAWARNVPGRSYVGSGKHVHAVSLLDPRDAASPQVYGSWAQFKDGLGGGPGSDPAPHYQWIPGLMDKVRSMGIGEIVSLAGGGGGGGGFHFPNWIVDIAKNPLGYVKGLVTKPIDAMKERFGDGGLIADIAKAPLTLAADAAKSVWNMLPGGLRSFVGGAGKAMGWVGDKAGDIAGGIGHGIAEGAGAVGDALGFADGGILPYNGTMMYDNGGYLPPGLTSVVNLTGKPEPVFTADQFGEMGNGAGAGFHYEPHFEGSDLTAADVASDIDFAYRKMRRAGKYQGALR